MYRNIALSKKLSWKEKIKNTLAYFFRRRGARILWNAEWGRVHKITPAYNTAADKQVEKEHVQYWQAFRKKVNPSSMRMGYNIAGIADPKIIPEEVFMSDIEPTLNRTASSVYLSYKSIYNSWFGEGVFPKDYIHNVDGDWLDHRLKSIPFDQVRSIARGLNYPVVMKPNRDSFGGSDVFFPKSSQELEKLMEGRSDFLVQEKLSQHEFFTKFNTHGINSMRVNIYRSVADNQLHVINMAFRMGVGGSLDNLTSGGIGVMVRKDGTMDGFALDGKGRKFPEHPDTGMTFDHKIPDFEQLKDTALKVAEKILYARIICLDMCYDAEGKWRMIEVNLSGTTLMFAHYHGIPFFEQYTDEVRDYCIKEHWTLTK